MIENKKVANFGRRKTNIFMCVFFSVKIKIYNFIGDIFEIIQIHFNSSYPYTSMHIIYKYAYYIQVCILIWPHSIVINNTFEWVLEKSSLAVNIQPILLIQVFEGMCIFLLDNIFEWQILLFPPFIITSIWKMGISFSRVVKKQIIWCNTTNIIATSHILVPRWKNTAKTCYYININYSIAS